MGTIQSAFGAPRAGRIRRGPASQRAIRSAIEQGECPWCDEGPFDQVAGHVSRLHGINARQLRDLAGLPYRASLSSEYLAETLSSARKAYLATQAGRETMARAQKASRGRPRRQSEAALAQRRRARLVGSHEHDDYLRDVRTIRVSALIAARGAAVRYLGRRWGANLLVAETFGIPDTMVESAVARANYAKPIQDLSVIVASEVGAQLRRIAVLAARSASHTLKRTENERRDLLRTALAQIHLSVLEAEPDAPLTGKAPRRPLTTSTLVLSAPSGVHHRDHPVFEGQTYCGVRFPSERPNSGWRTLQIEELIGEAKMCRTCFRDSDVPELVRVAAKR